MAEANQGAVFEDNEDMVIDMTGVDENAGGFQVLPRGIYPSIVDDLVFGASKNSGNPMFTWTFEVSEGEFAGRKLFFHSVLTAEQLPRLKKILMRIAPDVLEGPFKPKEVAEQGSLVGRQCRVRVDIRKYEGEDRNNVRDVLAPENGENGESFLS